MQNSMTQEILTKGMKGGGLGAVFGLLLGMAVSGANMILYEKEIPLTYGDKYTIQLFRNLETVSKVFKWRPDLVILAKYKNYNMKLYNSACIHTQRLVDLKTEFTDKRRRGEDAVKCVAQYHTVALKADRSWRKLFTEIHNRSDAIGAMEARTAAMNLHVAYEHALSEMRDEFQRDTQMKKPARAEPQKLD